MNHRFAKHIIIKLRGGDKVTVTREQFEAIAASQQQLVMIGHPDTGEWTGIAINKADIVSTFPDWEKQDQEIQERQRELDAEKMSLHSGNPANADRLAAIQRESRMLWEGRVNTDQIE